MDYPQRRDLSPDRLRTAGMLDLVALAGPLALQPESGLPPAPDFAGFAAAVDVPQPRGGWDDPEQPWQRTPEERQTKAELRVKMLEEMLAKEKAQADELRRQLRGRELRELAKEHRRIASVGQKRTTPSAQSPEPVHRPSVSSAPTAPPPQRRPSPMQQRPPQQTPVPSSPGHRAPSPSLGSERRYRQSWHEDPGAGTLKTDLHGVTHLLGGRQGARAQKWTSAWAHGLRGGPEWEDAEEDQRMQTGRPPWRGVSWNDRRAVRCRSSPPRQRSASPAVRRSVSQCRAPQQTPLSRTSPRSQTLWMTGGGGAAPAPPPASPAPAVARSITTPASACASPSRSIGSTATRSRSRHEDPGVGTLKTDLHTVSHLLQSKQGARAQKWTSAWAHGLRGGPAAEDVDEEVRSKTGRPPWCGLSWHQKRATRTHRRSMSPDADGAAVFSPTHLQSCAAPVRDARERAAR
eukprot:TRINITY_DN17200_c0_g1_i1.p1 TRINITY_DN17200_c0_g1~~TRINITY_DN17200_c0_g1_i1.p1  ORF type:complete len:475 (+),score=119.21 TRINITY_DN17200_c0_g1_i1:41-1426(+)